LSLTAEYAAYGFCGPRIEVGAARIQIARRDCDEG
jgi:hypothetical protein